MDYTASYRNSFSKHISIAFHIIPVNNQLKKRGKNNMNHSINIIGLGYIGLPTALMFATHDIEVVGTDLNADLVNKLKDGILTFEETGMEELLQSSNKKGIRYTTEYQKADVYIVAVPTPYDKNSKRIDPSYVISAVKSVLKVCGKGAIIVIESTVSPGTIDKYVRPAIIDNGFTRVSTCIWSMPQSGSSREIWCTS